MQFFPLEVLYVAGIFVRIEDNITISIFEP